MLLQIINISRYYFVMKRITSKIDACIARQPKEKGKKEEVPTMESGDNKIRGGLLELGMVDDVVQWSEVYD